MTAPTAAPRARLIQLSSLASVFALIVGALVLWAGPAHAAAVAPPLGTAKPFAVLAGAGITNTGPTTVKGDIGTFPTTSITGEAQIHLTGGGENHGGDAVAQGAKSGALTAYNNLAGQQPPTPVGADITGETLAPGIYKADTDLGLTGEVTLDGEGKPDAVFIFQVGTALTTAPGSTVKMINSAQACNVFWQVGSSATLGTNSVFRGNILADQSITAKTEATIEGRLLALNGAVTLDSNTITRADCIGEPTDPTPDPTTDPTTTTVEPTTTTVTDEPTATTTTVTDEPTATTTTVTDEPTATTTTVTDEPTATTTTVTDEPTATTTSTTTIAPTTTTPGSSGSTGSGGSLGSLVLGSLGSLGSLGLGSSGSTGSTGPDGSTGSDSSLGSLGSAGLGSLGSAGSLGSLGSMNPDKPDTPDVPGVPGSPDTPDGPGTPGSPDTPDTPDGPGTPEAPGAPGSPQAPGTSEGGPSGQRPHAIDGGEASSVFTSPTAWGLGAVLLALGGAGAVLAIRRVR